jgi:hypothetical protein
MSANHIFIHAWWRSGSTYVWSKLRENEALVCYYEPLHERLARLDLKTIAQPHSIEKSRSLRHPPQKEHYYAEYAELLRLDNLHFSPELSYDRYLLRPEQTNEPLRVYIDGLITAAFVSGRIPALCFCRSQMRSAWMRKVFGGTHIAQIRNPTDQWASFNRDRGTYFTDRLLTIALQLYNLHPTCFAHIEQFARFARFMSNRPASLADQLVGMFLKKRDLLALFLLIWTASTLQAISHCDFVLDIDRLSNDLGYRRTVMDWFATRGCSVDFFDCASPSSVELPLPAPELERVLDETTNAICTNASPLVIADHATVAQWLPSLWPTTGNVLRPTQP